MPLPAELLLRNPAGEERGLLAAPARAEDVIRLAWGLSPCDVIVTCHDPLDGWCLAAIRSPRSSGSRVVDLRVCVSERTEGRSMAPTDVLIELAVQALWDDGWTLEACPP